MRATAAVLAVLPLACGNLPTLPEPQAVPVRADEPAVTLARRTRPVPSDWLTFVGFEGGIAAHVHVQPSGPCPPIPTTDPPTYGQMEVWIAPYQGIAKTNAGNGDWTLKPLAPQTAYRVFAWYKDQCGRQHTSNELRFVTP